MLDDYPLTSFVALDFIISLDLKVETYEGHILIIGGNDLLPTDTSIEEIAE